MHRFRIRRGRRDSSLPRKRVSYANVVATLALFLALGGGTAWAASHYIIGSIHQIKPSVVKQLRGARGMRGFAGTNGTNGTNGAAGATGAPGPAGQWALISADHTTILAQSGGISIAATSGAGVYLNMGQDVNGEVVEATVAYLDDDDNFIGPIEAAICGGAPYGATCSASGTNDTHHVWVFTENPGGTVGADHGFYVAVFK
jgi:hypothetical protein